MQNLQYLQKKNDTLKTFFDEFEMEYKQMSRHGPTRWLSLHKCLNRVVLCWAPIKSYFLSQGEEYVSKAIWSFIENQADEATDINSGNITAQECYLYFVDHFLNLFVKRILLLERNNIVCSELHKIMEGLLFDLTNRKNDKFFGHKATYGLKKLQPHDINKCENDFLRVYTRAIEYLQKWYDFDNPPFRIFNFINLEDSVDYNTLIEMSKSLHVDVNHDELYDEVQILNKHISLLTCEKEIEKKWMKFFQNTHSPNLLNIVQPILSISVSNANVERVFSLMKQSWTDNRNKMDLKLIKAELCTKINYDLSCAEFYEYALSNENLLKNVRNSSKYK